MRTSLSTIRTKIVSTLYSIKKGEEAANNYTFVNTVPPNHVYKKFSAEFMGKKSDHLYPKLFVVSERGQMQKEPSESTFQTDTFLIIVVVKATKPSDDPEPMVESFLDDIELAIDNNNTLGGTVHDARVEAYSMDSGFAHPEGVVVIRVTVERYKR